MTLEEIQKQAESLPETERGELVASLLSTFLGPDHDVSDEEVEQRRRELDSGEVEDISFEELKKGLKFGS